MAPHPLTPRFEGCLLGGAIGDALGAPVEFMRIDEIRSRHGPAGITDFEEVFGRRGAITDDTQMTLFTAEGLIRATSARQAATFKDRLTPIHGAYLRWLHSQGRGSAHPDYEDAIDGWLIRSPALHSPRAPGNTCLSALMLPHPGHVGQPLNDSKGCGGVMRVAPIGLWGEDAFDLACRACALTHGHPSGYLAGGLFAAIIARLTAGDAVGLAISRSIEAYRDKLNPEVETAVDGAQAAARSEEPPSPETVSRLGEGWVAEEALAIALYCALVSPDFATGVRLAVNHSGDSDSTGSLTGNILGTAFGVDALPSAWLDNVELAEEIRQVAQDLASAHAGDKIDPARYPPH